MPEAMSNRVAVRPATPQDCRAVWEWRNEQATREASFNTRYIPYEEHKSWFAHKLTDPHSRIFMVANAQGRDAGYVRFDLVNQEATISVSIDSNERRKGYGTAAIKSAADLLLGTEPVHRVIAHIRRDNPASVAAFERAGFVLQGYTQFEGVDACKMVYEGKASAGAQPNRPQEPS